VYVDGARHIVSSFVGAVLRYTKVELTVNSIDLTAIDSVWTIVEGLPPRFGGVFVTIENRTEPSQILFDRCRFHGQVDYTLSFTFLSNFRTLCSVVCVRVCVHTITLELIVL